MSERVTIRAIAAGGDGVATLADGRTVFVPRSAPGDQIQLADIKRFPSFARAIIGMMEQSGEDRLTPPCPHYTAQRCGSCQLMHLSPAAQRAAKSRIAGDALRRIAKLDLPDPEIIAAPKQLAYRSKMTLSMVGNKLGYHPVGDATRVFDLHNCLLVEPALSQLHAALRARLSLLPNDTRRVVFRLDQAGGMHLVVETAGTAWEGAGRLHGALGMPVTIWWQGREREPVVAAGDPKSWPAMVFEQVNRAMAATVRQDAIALLGNVSGGTVWDLYAGIGETTQALATLGASVESVELNHAAVALAGEVGPEGPQRHVGDVGVVMPRLSKPIAVITNPPRVGMTTEVTQQLLGSGAERIVYISCDPATLARDIKRLAAEYQLGEVKAYDQFPQTAHLEVVALLERRPKV